MLFSCARKFRTFHEHDTIAKLNTCKNSLCPSKAL